MEFSILGPLEVRRDGRPIALGGPKPKALLAMLLLHPNEPVGAERLALGIWGDDVARDAIRTVQAYIARLRKALGAGDVLTRTPVGYRLRVGPDDLDAERFTRLLSESRAALSEGRPEVAADLLRDALGLWRGPALAEPAFERFAHVEAARLEEERLAAIELRIEADLQLGRHGELIGELQCLVSQHPLRERLHAQLMLALYQTGRQADALQTYRDARRALVALGLEPSAGLRELERRILAQDPALDAPATPNTQVAHRESAPLLRVPLPPTVTIAREQEIAELHALVGRPGARLVTVVGPGGVGKTRVALEVARALAPRYADGAYFVSLAAVDTHEHVAATIARRLEVSLVGRETVAEALARHLQSRAALLVLDNFEHVIDAAPLVGELLATGPHVHVLATSRTPLRLRAERLFRLAPLAVPDEQCNDPAAIYATPAAALFVTTASARALGHRLTERSARSVGELCRRLDGLPLAIELAAGRLDVLTVPELALQLRDGLDGLGPGSRDAPARHHTLTAALQWSYRLLSSCEQATLAQLAVFAGGGTLEAAQAVTLAPLDVLEALVAQNLVVTRRVEDAPRRLVLLETVRDFARAQLRERSDAADSHERHCRYYLALAERACVELRRTSSPELMTELDREIHNARAALRWALDRPAPTLALRLASAYGVYWSMRAEYAESADWLSAALGIADDTVPAAIRAAALETYAGALAEPRTLERATQAALDGLALRRAVGDPAGVAASLVTLATLARQVHRSQDAYRYAAEAERLAEGADTQVHTDALHLMALMAPSLERALELGERAAAAHRATGNRRRLALLQTSLAYAGLIHGDDEVATHLIAEGIDAAKALTDPRVLSMAYGNAGLVALLGRDIERARVAFGRELELVTRHRFARHRFEPLNGLAAVAAADGRDMLAATLSGAADASSLDRHHPAVARRLDEGFFAPARRRIGADRWDAAYTAGSGLEHDQALEIARQLGMTEAPQERHPRDGPDTQRVALLDP